MNKATDIAQHPAYRRSLFLLPIALILLFMAIFMRPGGIGGTGIDNGGIGGTGISTGFIGKIDGFGSIIVNGEHIDYTAQTPVTINSNTASAEDLKIGQIVEVITRSSSDTSYEAQQINVRHEIVGTVEAVNGSELKILSKTVRLPDHIVTPTLGDVVAVSGFWIDDLNLLASRIDLANIENAGVLLEKPDLFGLDIDILSLSGVVQPDGFLYGYRLKDGATMSEEHQIVTVIASPQTGVLDVDAIIKTEPIPQVQVQAPKSEPIPEPRIPDAPKPPPVVPDGRPVPIKQDEVQPERPKIIQTLPAPERQERIETPVQIDEPETEIRRTDIEPMPEADQEITTRAGNETEPVRDANPIEDTRETLEDEPDLSRETDISRESTEPEQVERVETIDVETIERPETTDRPESMDRPEIVDRPETIDRIERVERPERIDRPERPERIERPDRPR